MIPALWQLEVANAWGSATKTEPDRRRSRRRGTVPAEICDDRRGDRWTFSGVREAFVLSRELGLTTYDCMYFDWQGARDCHWRHWTRLYAPSRAKGEFRPCSVVRLIRDPPLQNPQGWATRRRCAVYPRSQACWRRTPRYPHPYFEDQCSDQNACRFLSAWKTVVAAAHALAK